MKRYKSEAEAARATKAHNAKEISSLKAEKQKKDELYSTLFELYDEVQTELTESKSEIEQLKRAEKAL